MPFPCQGIALTGKPCSRILKEIGYCYQHGKTPKLPKSPKHSKARQNHGFKYEADVISRFKLDSYSTKGSAYTARFDASYKGIPVQIKTKKLSSNDPGIEMGDYFRQKILPVKEFILVLGFWDKDKGNIIQEYSWNITKDEWSHLFQYDHDQELKDDLRSISNERKDDSKWQDILRKHRQQWGRDREVKLLGKRDSKTQKRWQCSIRLSALQKFSRFEFV